MQLTGRTRFRPQPQGMWRQPLLVLQVEYRNIDPDRSPGSDFMWRDATVEDLSELYQFPHPVKELS